MTFEEFQATRRSVESIDDAIGADYGMGAGYVYDGDCYIEKDGSEYVLTIYNDIMRSDDLAELERELWQWAVDEGLFP